MKPSEWIRERIEDIVHRSKTQQTRVLLEGRAIMEFLDFWQDNDRTNGFLADLRRHVSARQEAVQKHEREKTGRLLRDLEEIEDG